MWPSGFNELRRECCLVQAISSFPSWRSPPDLTLIKECWNRHNLARVYQCVPCSTVRASQSI